MNQVRTIGDILVATGRLSQDDAARIVERQRADTERTRDAQVDAIAALRPVEIAATTDDAGFGVPSTFGGPVAMPTLDKLAQQGLRYNNFHTTALCSPTRAALLTGRNHHQVGFGNIAELSSGYPGYNSIIPPETATVAATLVAGCVTTDYGYRGGRGDYYYGQPRTDYRYYDDSFGYYGSYGFGRYAPAYYYDRYGRLVYGGSYGYYGYPYGYGSQWWYRPRPTP